MRYSVINGSKDVVLSHDGESDVIAASDDVGVDKGKLANIRSRYSNAICVVVIGGFKLGMTMARPNCCTTCSNTWAVAGPSRKW